MTTETGATETGAVEALQRVENAKEQIGQLATQAFDEGRYDIAGNLGLARDLVAAALNPELYPEHYSRPARPGEG